MAGEFKQFGSEVSMIGPRIFCDTNNNLLRRIIWIVLVLCGVLSLLYISITQIGLYLKYETTVSVTRTEATELEFPRIGVCNNNQVRASWFLETANGDLSVAQNLRESYEMYNAAIVTEMRQFEESGQHEGTDEIREYFKKYMDKPRFLKKDDVRVAAHQLMFINSSETPSGMLVKAFWQRSEIATNEVRNMLKPVVTDAGACFEFNKIWEEDDDILKVDHPGTDQGLWLVLNVATREYTTDASRGPIGMGIQMFIIGQYDWPNAEENLLFSAGYAYDIHVTKQYHKNLGYPYGECTDVVSLSDARPELNLSYQMEYSRNACMASCKASYIYENCGCVPDNMLIFYAKAICTRMSEELCGIASLKRFYGDKTYMAENCAICLDACTLLEFVTLPTFTRFNSRQMLSEIAKTGVTDAEAEENWLVVRIFFSSLLVTGTEESEAYSFYSLAADVGGAMGLFIGSAALTVVEIFDFLIVYACKKRKGKSQVVSSNRSKGSRKLNVRY